MVSACFFLLASGYTRYPEDGIFTPGGGSPVETVATRERKGMTALPLRQTSPTLYMKGIGNPTQARWALQASFH